MKGFQGRHKFQGWYYSKPVLLVLLIVLIFLARGVWGVYQKSLLSQEAAGEIRTEVEALAEMRDNLASAVARLETDSGLEAEIKRQLPVVKEGEGVIALVGEYNNQVLDKNISETETSQKWWQLVLSWFGF